MRQEIWCKTDKLFLVLIFIAFSKMKLIVYGWGVGENGIYVAVPEAEKFRIFHFKHDKKDKRSLSSDAIYAFGKDMNGHIWIGTYGGGLNVVDGIFPDLHFIHSDNGLDLYPKDECRKVRSIYCTSTGIMLVGTTDGLLSFSAKTDEYRKIQFNLNTVKLSVPIVLVIMT